MRRLLSTGAARGLGAALLFGLSTPVAKPLLRGTGPLAAAALLYLGAAAGFLLLAPLLPRRDGTPLGRGDLPLLAGVTVSGGIVAPVLMMAGLSRLDGTTASLLLNLELPLTIALAVGLFGESLSRREVAGAAAVLAGGLLLASRDGTGSTNLVGALAIAGAALGWAIDNNLSQRLSVRDPIAVVGVKAGVAGLVNLGLALATGGRIPGAVTAAALMGIGFLGYGVSIVLHMLALRELGAARQGTLFSTAPFAGAVGAVILLGERLSTREWLAGAVMALGVWAMVRAHRHGR